MGTRNLTCVVMDGKYVVAQYGQWDGYPEGQGKIALEFVRRMNEDKFRKRLSLCTFVTEDELGAAGEDWLKKYPYVTRDHGAAVLRLIQRNHSKPKLRNSIEFASDSLFCEWAYVIDLDKRVLEVYKGFNTSPLSKGERFSNFPLGRCNAGESQYFPIKHIRTYDFNDLPTASEFVRELSPPEE